jgi:pyruvate/2-oxoglutarate dehydrogenase complex dihydrolipoamide dehydrogenase (E3) component
VEYLTDETLFFFSELPKRLAVIGAGPKSLTPPIHPWKGKMP